MSNTSWASAIEQTEGFRTFHAWVTSPRVLITLLFSAFIMLGLAACAGLDLADYISVRTPLPLQQSYGLPSTLPLSQAELAYVSWHNDVSEASAQWRASIERGRETHSFLANLTLQTLSTYGPLANAVPGGAALLAGIAPLITLFIRRPGDQPPSAIASLKTQFEARLREEKEASFNEGRRQERLSVNILTNAPVNPEISG